MLTSLAPSPIARRIAFWFFFTSLTTSAFCKGIHDLVMGTRDRWSSATPSQKGRYVQQITALHMIASSRNVFDSSFSRANVKLLPSVSKYGIELPKKELSTATHQ